MIGYEEALALILRESPTLASEWCVASQAEGRVLAGVVASTEYLPPFDNSAMDGFAVRTGGAVVAGGTEFQVAGSQAAGDPDADAGDGAWEIMTGAHLPRGLDAVAPVEQVEVLQCREQGRPLRIRLMSDVEPGQHVRRCGEDVMPGVPIMHAGESLQAQHIMLLAALGIEQVAVTRRPRVAILTTGRELVDVPSQALQPGEIRNSNGPFLAARSPAAGAQVVYRATVRDEPAEFLTALDQALSAGADVVLSTGAVSMGRHDFVPDALHGIGARIHFHKVRIRPGKPLLFARLPKGQLYFGLPGNPVSSAVGLRFFVEPALRSMLGVAPERPLKARLASTYAKRAALRFHLKGSVDVREDGVLRACVLPGQESFRISPMLRANAWIVLPEQAMESSEGTLVDVYGLGHWQPPFMLGDHTP